MDELESMHFVDISSDSESMSDGSDSDWVQSNRKAMDLIQTGYSRTGKRKNIREETAVLAQNPHHARPTGASAEAQVHNAVQAVVVRTPNVLTGILLLKKWPIREPCFFRTRFLRRKPKMQNQESL
jgi:hypothetical protein